MVGSSIEIKHVVVNALLLFFSHYNYVVLHGGIKLFCIGSPGSVNSIAK